ncbi:MAG: ribonuclease HI [Clostridia bacterium]|nr:ribonuclease HI [Clostridia bacterium]
MKNVEIYTDGACSGNPGIGGWAGILIYKNHEKEISGCFDETTNNRMEMFAILQSLKLLKEKCNIKIYSDSAYVVNAFEKNYIKNWVNNGWKTADKKDVKNIDLWKALLNELKKHYYEIIKVKGHSDNIYNNKCDELARQQIQKCKAIKQISN